MAAFVHFRVYKAAMENSLDLDWSVSCSDSTLSLQQHSGVSECFRMDDDSTTNVPTQERIELDAQRIFNDSISSFRSSSEEYLPSYDTLDNSLSSSDDNIEYNSSKTTQPLEEEEEEDDDDYASNIVNEDDVILSSRFPLYKKLLENPKERYCFENQSFASENDALHMIVEKVSNHPGQRISSQDLFRILAVVEDTLKERVVKVHRQLKICQPMPVYRDLFWRSRCDKFTNFLPIHQPLDASIRRVQYIQFPLSDNMESPRMHTLYFEFALTEDEAVKAAESFLREKVDDAYFKKYLAGETSIDNTPLCRGDYLRHSIVIKDIHYNFFKSGFKLILEEDTNIINSPLS